MITRQQTIPVDKMSGVKHVCFHFFLNLRVYMRECVYVFFMYVFDDELSMSQKNLQKTSICDSVLTKMNVKTFV